MSTTQVNAFTAKNLIRKSAKFQILISKHWGALPRTAPEICNFFYIKQPSSKSTSLSLVSALTTIRTHPSAARPHTFTISTKPVAITTDVEKPKPNDNPCIPSPCGANSQCRVVGETAACSCLPNYIGRAPNCRPECIISAECPANLACIKQKCSDPCIGACGVHAQCSVMNHNSICQCEPGFTGDPFNSCREMPKRKILLSYLPVPSNSIDFVFLSLCNAIELYYHDILPHSFDHWNSLLFKSMQFISRLKFPLLLSIHTWSASDKRRCSSESVRTITVRCKCRL